MRRFAVPAALAVVLAALLASPAYAAPASPAHAAQSGSSAPQTTTLDLVMLVDESGSLTDAEVADEIQAAGILAQSQLNPDSRVTIIGFGGVNGVAPDQDPTNVACNPTVASGKFNLSYLAHCVRKLHRRTEAEGDDTDYIAALSQALSYLSQQPAAGATKAIIMMTDGGLDVSRDPQYLPDWQVNAHHAVDLQLTAAKAAGVQVWPLGFGVISQSAGAYLNHLSQGGAQDGCVVKPHPIVVYNTTDAVNALDDLYAAASCSGESKSPPVSVSGGQTKTMTVSIPAIASAVAISVDKGNPNFGVTYQTPGGATVSNGKIGGETFARSGQDTAVDVLHVANPQPGTWKITVSAPKGQATELVSVTAFWQGAVRTSILASPPTAHVGQPIKVTLSVLGAAGPITSLAAVRQLRTSVTVSGDGITTPEVIPVSNTGESSSTTTGVGDFYGTFTAPTSAGTLSFVGTVSGYGLNATQVPTEVQVSAASAGLQGSISFSAPATITDGSTITGQILFQNRTGSSQRVALTLGADHALATVTSPAGTFTVPSGNSVRDFDVKFAGNSPPGNARLVVRAVDAANPKIVYVNGDLVATVQPIPGPWGKYHWEILGLIALLLLLLAALVTRNQLRASIADVRGLYAILRNPDDAEINEVKAPNRPSDTFKFALRDSDGRTMIGPWRTGDAEFAAKRDIVRGGWTGTVTITTPDRHRVKVRVDGDSEELPGGLRIAMREPAKKRRQAKPGADEQAPRQEQWQKPGQEQHDQGTESESAKSIWD